MGQPRRCRRPGPLVLPACKLSPRPEDRAPHVSLSVPWGWSLTSSASDSDSGRRHPHREEGWEEKGERRRRGGAEAEKEPKGRAQSPQARRGGDSPVPTPPSAPSPARSPPSLVTTFQARSPKVFLVPDSPLSSFPVVSSHQRRGWMIPPARVWRGGARGLFMTYI